MNIMCFFAMRKRTNVCQFKPVQAIVFKNMEFFNSFLTCLHSYIRSTLRSNYIPAYKIIKQYTQNKHARQMFVFYLT